MKKLFISSLVLAVFSCKKIPDKPAGDKVDSVVIEPKPSNTNSGKAEINKEEIIKKTNDEILQALKNKDYKKFAEFIHPEKGIRFSMYAFVDTKKDKHFSKADFEKYSSAKTVFTWGMQDGSGDLYKATISDYLGKWVFSKDFTAAQYSLNHFQGEGNSLNNLKKVYPDNDFTENYIKGTEKYSEMDWKTLRLIFEEFQGKYYLVNIINDQWTI